MLHIISIQVIFNEIHDIMQMILRKKKKVKKYYFLIKYKNSLHCNEKKKYMITCKKMMTAFRLFERQNAYTKET